MNDFKVFAYGEKDIRTVEIDGEPWWVLKDVCDAAKHKGGLRHVRT